MREALKNLFSNKIILENGASYYYYIKPYELINALGSVVAVLQEYTFSNADETNEQGNCTLYKTKEGNWYDVAESRIVVEKNIVRMLKTAIDKKEGEIITG